jgi:hypothetical protein
VNVYVGSQPPKIINRPSCETSYIPWNFGRSTTSNWTSKNGGVCRINNFHPEYIAKIEIVDRPHHGAAGMAGRVGVAYKPQTGFQGRDTFTYVVTSNQNFQKGAGITATITINVDVQ